MQLKAAGFYEEPRWDGTLKYRGQNAPNDPMRSSGIPPIFDARIQATQDAYVNTQANADRTLEFENGHVVHCRCKCVCHCCRTYCDEKRVKDMWSDEQHARSMKQWVNAGLFDEDHNLVQYDETPPSPIPVVAEDESIPVSVAVAEPEPEPFQRPPRQTSPEVNWPFVRCKAVYRALKPPPKKVGVSGGIIQNHALLLQWLADWFSLSLEEFKAKSLYDLAKEKPELFTYEARSKLFTAYPPRSDIGRELRSVLKL